MPDLEDIVSAWENYGDAQDHIRHQQEHCPHCYGSYLLYGEQCVRCERLTQQANRLYEHFLDQFPDKGRAALKEQQPTRGSGEEVQRWIT